MDKLKQRRDDRKKKAEDDKLRNEGELGSKADNHFEKLMRLKKNSINLPLEPVGYCFNFVVYVYRFWENTCVCKKETDFEKGSRIR